MSEFLASLAFSLNVTGPISLILMLGVYLRRIGLLTDAFVEAGSRLVFNVTLPALLFISVSKTHISESANFALIGLGAAITLVTYLLLEIFAYFSVKPTEDRGVVVQGAFRSNMGIIGLAYCANAYGEAGVAAASLYLGLITILFNILSVITLSRSLHKQGQGIMPILKGIAKNPLIIGILLALPVSYLQLKIPEVVLKSGEYFAQMTLPLALLCTGASLSFKSMRQDMRNTVSASLGKLIFIPIIFTLGGIWAGFSAINLGVLALMAFAPTAAASYVMVRAMGGNSVLAANIIAVTTLGSVLTTSIGIAILKGAGLM